MVLPPVTVMKIPSPQKTVLITGCSEHGLGDALAQALHRHGYRVFATARNPSKISHFENLGIETLPLDVLSPKSIEACISSVTSLTGGSLDMLINNSGAGYSMPLIDVSIPSAHSCFDLNVFALLSVTQAFLPLLMKSPTGGVIANNTSVASVAFVPHQGIYNASKAAAAMLTDNLRVELAPFGIKVVELKTGGVKTNFFANLAEKPTLPENSIYQPAREEVEKAMTGESISAKMTAQEWAEKVVRELNVKTPPARIWKGESATTVWAFRKFLPHTFPDGLFAKMGGLNVLGQRLGKGSGKSWVSAVVAKLVGA